MKNCEVLLGIDYSTAISYVKKMDGTHVGGLNEIAQQIWEWYSQRNVETFTGGRDSIRKAFVKQICLRKLEIMLSFLAPTTMKQYSNFLMFLTKKHEEGAAYGRLDTIKSAVGTKIQGQEFLGYLLPKRFFDGIYRRKSPKPKYDQI